jgi:hypothetical protein
MILSKADLIYLKLSMGALLLSLVLGGGIISLSNKYQEQSLKDRQSAQNQLADARTQLSSVQNDQENMAAYAMEYDALLTQKVIGNEQRLDWIEGLENLRQQGHVLDFNYTIAPQQSYAPDPPLEAGNFQLNRSGMTMQMDLLHEEQLLHLLAAMHTQMQGWFMLDGCTLSRTGSGDKTTPLKAECTGGWFTMKNRAAP